MRDETMTAKMASTISVPTFHHKNSRKPLSRPVKTKFQRNQTATYSIAVTRVKSTTLDDLPNEILGKIFAEAGDVKSVLHFAATCKHLRNIWASCNKVQALHHAASIEYEPFEEAVQLVTYNMSTPAHLRRHPLISMALIKQVIKVGNTANAWLDKYPQLRWDDVGAADRRLLKGDEATRFRRALYRFWLYSAAFHSPDFFITSSYNTHVRPSTSDPRLTFVRHLTTEELIECAEVHELLHIFVRNEICPSNSKIQTHYNILNPNSDPIYFGSYSSYPSSGHSHVVVHPRLGRDLGASMARESWGSEVVTRGHAADLMKLTPAELLEIQALPRKTERQMWLDERECFYHLPATFRASLEAVMVERGESGLGSIEDYEGWAGILDVSNGEGEGRL